MVFLLFRNLTVISQTRHSTFDAAMPEPHYLTSAVRSALPLDDCAVRGAED